jgi:hypothetical protein
MAVVPSDKIPKPAVVAQEMAANKSENDIPPATVAAEHFLVNRSVEAASLGMPKLSKGYADAAAVGGLAAIVARDMQIKGLESGSIAKVMGLDKLATNFASVVGASAQKSLISAMGLDKLGANVSGFSKLGSNVTGFSKIGGGLTGVLGKNAAKDLTLSVGPISTGLEEKMKASTENRMKLLANASLALDDEVAMRTPTPIPDYVLRLAEPRFEVEPITPLMARLPEMFEELLTHTRDSNKKAKSDSRWAKILGVIVAVETLGLIVLGYVTWQATL